MFGGACELQPYEVTFLAPDSGFYTNNPMLQIRVGITSSNEEFPTQVPVNGPNTTVQLSRDDGGVPGMATYSGIVTIPGADGLKTYVAGWDVAAQPKFKASRNLTLDRVPPTAVVVALPAPTRTDPDPMAPNAWKKDESVLVKVQVTDSLSPLNDVVPGNLGGLQGASAIVTSSCPSCVDSGDKTSRCFCFAVPLDKVALKGMRGSIAPTVTGVTDRATNAALPATTSSPIEITRYKWVRSIPVPASSTRMHPVAVTRTGAVVAAVQEGRPGVARLQAFQPSGSAAWSGLNQGFVTTAPVVGPTSLFVGTVSPSNDVSISAFDLGTWVPRASPCPNARSSYEYGALGFAGTGSSETPVGIGRDGSYWTWAPCIAGFLTLRDFGDQDDVVSMAIQTNQASGFDLFLAFSQFPRLWKIVIPPSAFPVYGFAELSLLPKPRGLFIDSAGFVGVGGTGSVSTARSNGSFPIDGGVLANVSNHAVANGGMPILGRDAVFFSDSDFGLNRVPYSNGILDSQKAVVASIETTRDSTPALGGDGLVYYVGNSAKLSVLEQSTLTELWSEQLGDGVRVSELALDTSRPASGGAKDCTKSVGVLYVLVSGRDSIARLWAILVDSKGLDPTAPWPKFQRDNANTANVSYSLSDWTCP
jgi:outer membrane protein assembly factor BamB